MSRIHLLDDHLISKIAAGEVVERPASVVKELLENAIDAGATNVEVELEKGGKRRIVIRDDGVGMDADDALLAFDRHATSKIESFDDLEHVETLGFRGEALASIASVARVELRTAESPGDGHRVRIEGGRVKSVAPISHPRGTHIEVASLFWNVPARRKFLKQPSTELRRSVEVVQGYALAHPEVGFRVVHEGRTLLETVAVGQGSEELRERIIQVFGRELGEHLEPIPERFSGEREAIRGFVGDRTTARGRKSFLYVNGRLVRDRALLATFYRAAREIHKGEDYPSLFLMLDLEPENVDVNVHPQKAEVRFRDPRFVDRVETALRETLERTRGEEQAPLRAPRSVPPVSAVWEGLGGRGLGGRGRDGADDESWRTASEVRETPVRYDASPPRPGEDRDALLGGPQPQGLPPRRPEGTATFKDAAREPERRIAQPSYAPMAPKQVPLSGRSGEVRPFRLLGQYKGSMILLEGPDGLYLIDQHVAHERLLYERVRRALESEASSSQRLLDPPLLELSAAEAMRLGELAEALEPCGFEIAPMSGNAVAMIAIPTVLSIRESESLLRELATSEGETLADAERLRREILDALAASLACRAAVKMHHVLSVEEMERLITELFEAEQPYSCPHGRPVVLQMTDVELERRFGRR